ncbi:MAG: hypothetical protein R3E73_13525 [Porticoccaceae bacterium]
MGFLTKFHLLRNSLWWVDDIGGYEGQALHAFVLWEEQLLNIYSGRELYGNNILVELRTRWIAGLLDKSILQCC